MKVVIIGASISGLFTAYLLAQKGLDVEVHEMAETIGAPARTLIVTNKLNDVLDFVPEEAIVNKVNYIELFSKSRSTKIGLNRPDLIIERGKFVELLSRLAQGAGVKIVYRHQFIGFGKFGRKIVVSLRNLETGGNTNVSTDILVGADGVLSAVSRAASKDGHRHTALLQARMRMPENLSSDTVQVWFDSTQTEYFCWLIPESNEVAVVGLIAKDKQKTEEALITFLRQRQMDPVEFQSATVPKHRFELMGGPSSTDQNVFIVGDAAAQVKLTTVGGVVAGLHGARALANAILDGRNYRKELRGLKLELDLHLLIRHVLERFDNEDYDQLIGMVDRKLKGILAEWDRDELAHSFLKLIWAEPRLITLGAKALFKSII
jgi:flavin-dependent dehydrogenase